MRSSSLRDRTSSPTSILSVSIVYATYVAFEPVWANLLRIITPRLLLSLTTAAWGFITLGTAFVSTYSHLITARVILGIFEAGCVSLLQVVFGARPTTLADSFLASTCTWPVGAFPRRSEKGADVFLRSVLSTRGARHSPLLHICLRSPVRRGRWTSRLRPHADQHRNSRRMADAVPRGGAHHAWICTPSVPRHSQPSYRGSSPPLPLFDVN